MKKYESIRLNDGYVPKVTKEEERKFRERKKRCKELGVI